MTRRKRSEAALDATDAKPQRREVYPPACCAGCGALRPWENLCIALTSTARSATDRFCLDGHCHDPAWVAAHGAAHRQRVERKGVAA